MTLNITKEMKRLIERQLRAGRYESPEQVVLAALGNLQLKQTGDFCPGELDDLLAEGEASIKAHGTLDSEVAFEARRARRARRRKAS
jgi:Arc/MetJ-type ribon-helix-helix transcriptional regulator